MIARGLVRRSRRNTPPDRLDSGEKQGNLGSRWGATPTIDHDEATVYASAVHRIVS
jgi:hypothetical protein